MPPPPPPTLFGTFLRHCTCITLPHACNNLTLLFWFNTPCAGTTIRRQIGGISFLKLWRQLLKGFWKWMALSVYFCLISILTSTPEKQRLLDEVEAKKLRAKPAMKSVIAEKKVLPNPSICKGKGQDKGNKRRIRPEVNWKCMICSDWYCYSLPGEEWAQCIDCEDWAHSDCTDGRDAFMCELCQQKIHSDSRCSTRTYLQGYICSLIMSDWHLYISLF